MAKMSGLVLYALVLALAGCSSDPGDGTSSVMINDFNSGDGKNALGFCLQTFSDASGRSPVNVNLGGKDRSGRGGYSLQLDFDVSGAGKPFGGYIEMLVGVGGNCGPAGGQYNARGMSELHFWVKRSSANIDMEIAVMDIHGKQTTSKRLLREVAPPDTSWTEVRISLADLVHAQDGQLVDLSALREINFGFAKERFQSVNAALSGTVYLDDIGFNR